MADRYKYISARKRDNLLEFLTEMQEYITDNEDVLTYEDTIEFIPCVSTSGFTAFTDGGISFTQWGDLYTCWGSGCTPKEIEPYLDQTLKDISQEMKDLFDIDSAYSFDDLTTEQQEHLQDIELSYLSESAEYFWQGGIYYYEPDNNFNDVKEPTVYIWFGINTDFHYGREKGLNRFYERYLPLSRATPSRLEQIARAAKKAIDKQY